MKKLVIPISILLNISLSAQDYFQRGVNYAKANNYNLAISDLSNALSIGESYFWRAYSYEKLNQDLYKIFNLYSKNSLY